VLSLCLSHAEKAHDHQVTEGQQIPAYNLTLQIKFYWNAVLLLHFHRVYAALMLGWES
jgi:hypothetical protein